MACPVSASLTYKPCASIAAFNFSNRSPSVADSFVIALQKSTDSEVVLRTACCYMQG